MASINMSDFLRQLQQCQTEEEKAVCFRNGLCKVVHEAFHNLTKLQPNQETAQVTLDFISHTIAECPQIYVASLNNISDETPALSQLRNPQETEQDKSCWTLVCWLMCHLLRILAHEECRSFWRKTQDVLVSLLQMIKPRDPHVFAKLCSELIAALGELSIGHEEFYGDRVPVNQEIELKRFTISQSQEGDNLRNSPIVLKDPESCELLQTAISTMLCEMASDLCLFCVGKVSLSADKSPPNLLWATVGCQLEYGEIELKKVSLKLASQLMLYGGLPHEQVTEYVIGGMVALLDLLSAGFNDIEGDYQGLEMELADCLNQMVVMFNRPLHHLDKAHQILSMVQDIAKTVVNNGLSNLRTLKLKTMVCDSLRQLYRKLPPGALCDHLNLQQLKQVAHVLMSDIGTESGGQHAVPCLEELVMLELEAGGLDLPHTKSPPETSETAVHEDDATKHDKMRKKKPTTFKGQDREETVVPRNIGHEEVMSRSTTLTLLIAKIEHFCEQLQEDGEQNQDFINSALHGLQVALQVLVWCIVFGPRKKEISAPVDAKSTQSSRTPSKRHQQVAVQAVSCVMAGCIDEAMLQMLSSTWKHCLQMCSHRSDLQKDFSDTFRHIVSGVGALVFVQDELDVPPEILMGWCWMISLHWLPNDMSWRDLKVAHSSQISAISSVLADKIGEDVLAECVYLLALLPKDVASKWRCHILNDAVGDHRIEVRKAAVEGFPMFLYHSGPNANHLVYDMLHGMVEDHSSCVRQSLATIMGCLACFVSRRAVLHRPQLHEWDVTELSYRALSIQCTCDSKPDGQGSEGSREKLKSVDPQMFVPFFKLLTPGDASNRNTRMAMVQSLSRLFGHIGVRASNNASIQMLNTSLSLLRDPDHAIRMHFSVVLPMVVLSNTEDGTSVIQDAVSSHLRQARILARDNNNSNLMKTTLYAVGQLGRMSDGDMLLIAVYILLDNICVPCSPLTAAVAHQQLKDIAAHKKMKTKQLFIIDARNICKILADSLHDAQRKKSRYDAMYILTEVAKVFDFHDVETFLKRTEHYLLPHLVKKATSTSSHLIRLISKQLKYPNHKGPLARNMSYIYCHLVCYCQDDELIKIFSYLEMESEWDLEALLRCGSNIDIELLVRLGTHYDKVLKGLRILGSKLGEFKGSSIQDIGEEQLVEYLQPKLLGSLVHFDNLLNNTSLPLHEKKEAYESVIALIRLMGTKHITTVRMRVMTTLRIGLKFTEKGFPELLCRAWNCFVRSLEPASLGPMLSQIVVNLQPLLTQLPRQVSQIYSFLIIDNRKQLSSHFHELYFLPDIPELADVNSVLQNYMSGPASEKDLRVQITQILKGITHESLDVRQMALVKLKHQLHGNQAELHKLILGSETVDPVISELVNALLTGCGESDQTVRSLYGECLGEVGAIDPGRLELMSSVPKPDLKTFLATLSDDRFAFELITQLARAFIRAEDRNTQDCVAFSIQELIQIYNISCQSPANSAAHKLWNKFPDEIQDIMMPLMTSRYMLTMESDWSNQKRPIYNSKKGQNFQQWISTLTGFQASKVKDDKAEQVFKACRGIIKNDSNIALYLLPHVTVQVLLDGGQQDHDELCMEILAVLKHVKNKDTRHGSASDLRHLSAQTVFSVLDHLTKWLRHRVMVLSLKSKSAAMSSGRKTTPSSDFKHSDDKSYKVINGFLERIPQDVLALASYNCSAYTRALMHFEMSMAANKDDVQLHLDFLQKVYVALDEPDGVAGVTAIKQTQPTLNEQILAFESIGQLSDASVCYDRALQLEPEDLTFRQGQLRCRLALGELSAAMELCNGMIAERRAWSSSLNVYRVEAAWKLGQWHKLTAYLKSEDQSRNWNVGLGKVLLAVKSRNAEEFSGQLRVLRGHLMGPLSAASMEVGSYHRGYEYITRLHLLNELEQGVRSLLEFPATHNGTGSQTQDEPFSAEHLIQHWQNRLTFTQSSFRTQEPILNMRRVILGLGKEDRGLDLDKEIGLSWLQTAKASRKSGLVQTAHSALLSASAYNLPEFCIENAKWLWDRGDYDKAQSCLEKSIEVNYPDRSKMMLDSAPKDHKLACAKMMLLLGKYCEETASWESNAIVKQYKEVTKISSSWEEGYFYMAKYYDKLMTTLVETDRPDRKGEFALHVVQNFGYSMMHGNQFIYQSMPRMLTLWLDYGAEQVEREKKPKNEVSIQASRAMLSSLNKHMSQLANVLAPYQFLTAFPQLISRICHAHPEVFLQLKEIIAKMLVVFPQQSVWMMMAVSKSSYQNRARRCQDIFGRAKSLNGQLGKFLQDATKLTDRLLDLCNRTVDSNVPTLSITQHFKPLQRLLHDKHFSPILLPLQSLMTVTLPSGSEISSTHDPFPCARVTISGIEDTVEVLPSLQRPKKITLQGSDGKLYIMLCKPKDDLRKDARLMEFNAIVNKCLRKDPESRRRDLHIRTYTVTTLNEECGMLEWVSNTGGLRQILMKLYQERGGFMTGRELRAMLLPNNAPLQQKLEVFKTKLMPRHPALFSEWFLKTFPDPTSWYNARLSYCRTTAVMSMVGYILGLGDRHGENILLDSTNGDCVHVDFNCLFNKGETFDYPEIVPFRLTHNMVEAMGPTGVEGVFRRACEVTMRVMRDQSDSLMSVLKPFLYDPLVEWSKPVRGRSNATETGEIKNEKAFTHVSHIESRLKGIMKKKTKPRGLPLSVEGHVNHLIKEATEENNLCQMYIGWAPYL